MNRRNFLKNLGLLTAAIAVPKLIFDMGANSHIYTRKLEIIHREFRSPGYDITQIQASKEFEETFGKIVENIKRQNAGYFVTAKEAGLTPEYSYSVYSLLGN